MSKIKVCIFGNESMMGFGIKRKLVHKHFISEYQKPEDFEYGTDEGTFELRDQIQGIEGVVNVTMWPYQIRLEKADVYDWNEVVPSVLEVLKSFLNEEVEVVVDDQRSPHDFDHDGYPSGRRELKKVLLGIPEWDNPKKVESDPVLESIDPEYADIH